MSGVCMHALHVWGCNDGADRVVPLLFCQPCVPCYIQYWHRKYSCHEAPRYHCNIRTYRPAPATALALLRRWRWRRSELAQAQESSVVASGRRLLHTLIAPLTSCHYRIDTTTPRWLAGRPDGSCTFADRPSLIKDPRSRVSPTGTSLRPCSCRLPPFFTPPFLSSLVHLLQVLASCEQSRA